MAATILADIRTDILDQMAHIQHDPCVAYVEMIPDEHHGTVWLIRLHNGENVWVGAGQCDTTTQVRSGYNRMPRVATQVVATPDQDPILLGEIEKWIRRKYPDTNKWALEDDLVLYGLVQAGKTELILSMIWIAQYVYELPCVLVLANMAASYHQVLGKNATEFNDMLLQEFGGRARPFFLRTAGYRGNNTAVGGVEDHTWLRVAMGNPAQLRRLLTTLPGRFALFCDEADVHVKGWNEGVDHTSTGPLMKQLQEMAVGTVKITATPFALFNQEGALQKTLVMRTPPEYRGLLETEWVFSSDDDAKQVRKGNAPRAVRLLKEMVRVLRPRVENERRRYMTILVNGPATIARQNALAKAIAKKCPQWNAYVMNSDGGKSSIQKARPNHTMMPTGKETISSLYDMLEREQTDGFSTNIIVACLTAARAISFRPTSRRIGTGGLHGMMFFPSPGCHAAQLIQFMRVWGKFEEDYPMIRVVTTKTTYDKLYAEITHNLSAMAEATSETGLSRVQIEGVRVVDVGLHDRRAVDDTHLTDRMPMLKQEFATEQDVRTFLAGDYGNRITIMTERIVMIPRSEIEGGFYYGEHIARIEQHRMTKRLKEILINIPFENGFQVCWHDTRYEDHHTITRRYSENASGVYMARVIAGSGDNHDRHVNIVVWKPQYSKQQNANEDWSLSRFREDRAYIFQTTKNTWRYYTTNEKRRYGFLSHS